MIQNLGKTKKKGAAILIAIILCAVMLFAAISLSMVSVSQIKIAQATKTSNVAYQIADAGMEEILRVLLQEDDFDPTLLPPAEIGEIVDDDDDVGIDGADGEVDSEGNYRIKKDIEINGSDEGTYYIYLYDEDDNNLDDENTVDEIYRLRCQGVYKSHARVVETTIEPAS